MRFAAELLLAFTALYPVVTAAVWIAGGVLFRLFDERREAHVPNGGWPGVTVLIPAYSQVVATIRGPHESRVVWDTRREQLDTVGAAGE